MNSKRASRTSPRRSRAVYHLFHGTRTLRHVYDYMLSLEHIVFMTNGDPMDYYRQPAEGNYDQTVVTLGVIQCSHGETRSWNVVCRP